MLHMSPYQFARPSRRSTRVPSHRARHQGRVHPTRRRPGDYLGEISTQSGRNRPGAPSISRGERTSSRRRWPSRPERSDARRRVRLEMPRHGGVWKVPGVGKSSLLAGLRDPRGWQNRCTPSRLRTGPGRDPRVGRSAGLPPAGGFCLRAVAREEGEATEDMSLDIKISRRTSEASPYGALRRLDTIGRRRGTAQRT
jgi:hypothetical protein